MTSNQNEVIEVLNAMLELRYGKKNEGEQFRDIAALAGLKITKDEDPVLFRHNKTGGIYEWISEGVSEGDGDVVVIYKGTVSGIIWVRNKRDFHDGRFTQISPQETKGS